KTEIKKKNQKYHDKILCHNNLPNIGIIYHNDTGSSGLRCTT
ncbi:hypothetical protein DOY81_008729, partial [Sarcophaga bullata]